MIVLNLSSPLHIEDPDSIPRTPYDTPPKALPGGSLSPTNGDPQKTKYKQGKSMPVKGLF